MKKIILISFMLITSLAFASDLKDCSDNIKQSRAEEISASLLPTLAYTKKNEIQFKGIFIDQKLTDNSNGNFQFKRFVFKSGFRGIAIVFAQDLNNPKQCLLSSIDVLIYPGANSHLEN